MEITVDAVGAALRMIECAIALFEAQSLGQKPNPTRTQNYPDGLAEMVERRAPRYR
jgi:hypothetical protein